MLQCNILRRRSRAEWASKGEQCSKYFFATIKTKQAQENMTALLDDEGREINDENLILGRIHKYYADLYSQPALTLEDCKEQERTLTILDRRVSEETNHKLLETPGVEELNEAVKKLPLDKALGEDGLPAEILRDLWEEINIGCLQFIHEVWKNKRIGRFNAGAVIKLLPKNENKEHLRNWRPISLLTLAYKLVGRILTNRMKKIIRQGADRLRAREEHYGQHCQLRAVPGVSKCSEGAEERNFRNLCKVIGVFEKISGALLNPAKSVIIPFAMDRSLPWLQETSCQILLPGQFITYLGCRFGVDKAEEERANDIRNKIKSKLGKWANRFLTWASKVLLLKHVLRALPVYHFLGLGLHRVSYKSLEAPCRAFLWGTNSDNRTKTALVGWNTLNKAKTNGGLQFRPFQRVSETLKMRYVGRLLNGEVSDWSQMMKYFIRQQLQNRSNSKELKYWTAEEALLLLPSLSIPQSETTHNIVQSWFRFRKYLRLDNSTLILPGSLTLRQTQALLSRYRDNRPFNERITYPLLKRIGVFVLANLSDSRGKWIEVDKAIRDKGIQLTVAQAEAKAEFQTWLLTVKLDARSLEQSPSWCWNGADTKWKGWAQTSRFWYSLLEAEEAPDDLTTKWPERQYTLTWKQRWKNLWGSGGLSRVKLWTWRLLSSRLLHRRKSRDDWCCFGRMQQMQGIS
ncbi:hypothetical protein R1flu_025299 [Riccia fluitans]|uniref:Reverse transcriptase n=1 Tax=Riccia fluitans TaxID=41844 RepID=A0ABD1XXE1_9MARC